MIDDRKLEKILRRQVKVGLTIYVGGEEIAFIGANWMARTTMERLSKNLRITLGALVEMLGFIPGEGAIRIRKVKDDYEVQDEMQTVVANQIGTFLDSGLCRVKRTNISYGWAVQLWQARSGKLYGQTAERADTGGNNAWLNGAGVLVIRDLDSCEEQYIKASRPEDDTGPVRRDLWEHLEKVMWTDWSEDPVPEPEDDTEPPEEQIILQLPAPEDPGEIIEEQTPEEKEETDNE